MRAELVALALTLAPFMMAHARDEVPPRALGRIKLATVLVKASTVRGEQQGAGFLVYAKGGMGFIVANAHVVQSGAQPSRRVECVFRSGTAEENVLPAKVVSVDRDRDVAILQVKSNGLPAAVSLNGQTRLRESTPIYVIGFSLDPPGTSKGRHAAVTVAKGAVAAATRGAGEGSETLQIDAPVNTGNSGGPIVDASGHLIGMAVAAREGQKMASVIPPQEMKDTLYGKIDQVNVTEIGQSRRRVEYKFDVKLVDPMDGIRSVFVHTTPRDKVRGGPPRNRDGSFGPVASKMRAHKLEVSGGKAAGNVFVETRGGRVAPQLYQLRFIRGDNATVYTAPAPLEASQTETSPDDDASVAGSTPDEGGPPDARRPAQMPKPSTELQSAGLIAIDLGAEKKFVKKLPGPIIQLAVGGAGRYFIMQFEDQGEIGVFDINKGDIVTQISAPTDAILAASVDKLFIFSPADNAVRRWSLSKLREERTPALSIEGTVTRAAIGHACRGPLLLQVKEDDDRVGMNLFVDPTSLKPQPTREVWVKHRRGVAAAPTKPNGAFGMPMVIGGDYVTRASGSGQVFGIWSKSRGMGMTVMIDEKTAMCFYDEMRYGHLLPMPDGAAVCTARGYVKSDLSRSRDRQYLLPSYHPEYYISVALTASRQTGKIIDRKTGRPVADLPETEHMVSTDAASARESRLLPDQRFHYLPQAKVLMTFPPGDEMVVQQVDFEPRPIAEDVAEATNSEATPTDPKKTESAESRTWKDRGGRFEIEAAFVSLQDNRVRLRKSSGQTVTVPLEELSRADVDYVKGLMQQTQPAAGKRPKTRPERTETPKQAPSRQRPRR